MYFPKFIEFIEQVRKSLLDPSTPILHIWYADFAEKKELYQSRKETSEEPIWETRIMELNRLQNEIKVHNRGIDERYIASVLEQFKSFPAIQAEIRKQFTNGFVIVGYKGVDIERALKIYEDDLNCTKTIGSPAGASRGEGFYTSPHFTTALDFAKFAARLKAAEVISELKDPPDPPSIAGSVVASVEYQRSINRFEHRKSDFESTDEWERYGVVARIYVKGFFAMHGCKLLDQKQPLPADWANFDYIEGSMQGGKNQWEIKFNKHESVYAAIRVFSDPRVDANPDLPFGSFRMLEAARLMLAKAETPQLGDVLQGGPS